MKVTTPVKELKNFGPKSASWLQSVGILTLGDLTKWDKYVLYFVLKDEGYPVSRNFLYAVYGAINNCDWRSVPDKVKKDIQTQLGL